MIIKESELVDMWNKGMDLDQLKRYATWIVNQMENTLDDYKYSEYEEMLFSVSRDIEELEQEQQFN